MTGRNAVGGGSRSRGGAGGWGRLALALALLASAGGCRDGSPSQEATPTLRLPATSTLLPTPTDAPPTPIEPSRTATPDCLGGVGRVETGTYPGAVVSQDVPYRIYLPPCYDRTNATYPALYLLHGNPYTESQWDELGADETASARIVAGDWPPFLIVMPLQPEPLFSRSDGGPRSYEAELLEGLLPYIERTYRADPVPRARGLAGISRGGVWALEIGLRNPDVFGAVAALSPALSVNHPRPAYDPFAVVAAAEALPKLIYLGAGEADWARAETERLSRSLTAADAENRLDILPGGHDAGYWTLALPRMMDFMVRSWCGCSLPASGGRTPTPPGG